MNRFDQGWEELNCEEKAGAVISTFAAGLLAVCGVGFTVLLYEAQIDKLKQVTMKCADRAGQKLVSEIVRTNGDVECRYVRNITGLAVSR